MAMRPERQLAILGMGVHEIDRLLAEMRAEIFEAYDEAFMEHDEEANKAFCFRLNAGIAISPVGDKHEVEGYVSFSVRKSRKAKRVVENTPDLPGMPGQPAALGTRGEDGRGEAPKEPDKTPDPKPKPPPKKKSAGTPPKK